jgi:hypothetical protein
MKLGASLTATVAAVLMLFGFSTLRQQGSETPPVTKGNGTTSDSARPQAQSPDLTCARIAQRLLRFAKDSNNTGYRELPHSCYPSGKRPVEASAQTFSPDVRFAIATGQISSIFASNFRHRKHVNGFEPQCEQLS